MTSAPPDARAALRAAGTVLCSACLLGYACRYDGRDQRAPHVERTLASRAVVPFCPEVAGGLSIPRPPAELRGPAEAVLDRAATVVDAAERDVTDPFVCGARRAVDAAKRHGATAAILKDGSPSCGVHRLKVAGRPVSGRGVATAALDLAGIAVLSDEDDLSGLDWESP